MSNTFDVYGSRVGSDILTYINFTTSDQYIMVWT